VIRTLVDALARMRTADHSRARDHAVDLVRDLPFGDDLDLDLIRDHALDAIRELDLARDFDLARDYARDLEVTRARSHDNASRHARTRVDAIVYILREARIRVAALDLGPTRTSVLDLTIARARRSIGEISDELNQQPNDASSLAAVQEHAGSLARDLQALRDAARIVAGNRELELLDVLAAYLADRLGLPNLKELEQAEIVNFLDDFTKADLSGVDVEEVDLAGVRWSVHTTQWPSRAVAEQIREESREMVPGSGLYVVTGRGETINTEALRV
jgi:hypothetical protein